MVESLVSYNLSELCFFATLFTQAQKNCITFGLPFMLGQGLTSRASEESLIFARHGFWQLRGLRLSPKERSCDLCRNKFRQQVLFVDIVLRFVETVTRHKDESSEFRFCPLFPL